MNKYVLRIIFWTALFALNIFSACMPPHDWFNELILVVTSWAAGGGFVFVLADWRDSLRDE